MRRRGLWELGGALATTRRLAALPRAPSLVAPLTPTARRHTAAIGRTSAGRASTGCKDKMPVYMRKMGCEIWGKWVGETCLLSWLLVPPRSHSSPSCLRPWRSSPSGTARSRFARQAPPLPRMGRAGASQSRVPSRSTAEDSRLGSRPLHWETPSTLRGTPPRI